MLTVIVIITYIWTLTTNSPSTLQALQSWCCDGLINIMTPILMCAGFQHSQFVAYWISFNAIECHNLLVLALDNPKYLWHIYDYDKFRLSVLNCSQDSGFHNYLRLGLLVPNLANPGRLRSCVQKLWTKKIFKKWNDISPLQEVRNPSASATAPSGASCLHLPIPLILVFTVFLTPVVTIMTRRIL